MSNSWTITDLDSTVELEDGPPLPPIHPGEMLREDFMPDMGLSTETLSAAMGVSPAHLQAILDGRAPITGEDSVRLGHAFDMTDGFWMRLQNHYDIELAKRSLSGALDHLPVLHAAE